MATHSAKAYQNVIIHPVLAQGMYLVEHRKRRMSASLFAALFGAAILLFSSLAFAASTRFEEALKSSSELYEQGRFQEAIPHAKQALAIAEREFGADDVAKAAPILPADEQAEAIAAFEKAGKVTYITVADVIAHHDKINRAEAAKEERKSPLLSNEGLVAKSAAMLRR